MSWVGRRHAIARLLSPPCLFKSGTLLDVLEERPQIRNSLTDTTSTQSWNKKGDTLPVAEEGVSEQRLEADLRACLGRHKSTSAEALHPAGLRTLSSSAAALVSELPLTVAL